MNIFIEFVDYLESIEMPLLSWGINDFFFSHKELVEEVEKFNAKPEIISYFNKAGINPETPDDFIEDLEEERLIFRYYIDDIPHYRSRTAETIRLTSKLRQLFPKHFLLDTWRTAPKLVGDYRILKRPRKYPDRNISALEITEELEKSNVKLDDLQLKAFEGLTTGFQFSDFQKRAVVEITKGVRGVNQTTNPEDSTTIGAIISAGTGSGKTLAFYLPALLEIIRMKEINPSAATRCIAIYPRNELLKDQISEVIILIRKINRYLNGNNKLKIGALFGATPKNSEDYRFTNKNTVKNRYKQFNNEGYYVPVFNCPIEICNSPLVWLEKDRKDKNPLTELVCSKCKGKVSSSEVILTREEMLKSPPDILFTTTEMLNKKMSDIAYAKLFCIGAEIKPKFFLLDEVHTYDGNHGAQVAYLIRRWKANANCSPYFVGLSATLRDAKHFFAEFCDTDEQSVVDIAPYPNQYIQEGAEYSLILRNDPTQLAALLSTTIQTAMLFRRVMDPVKSQLFGKKVFLFTDDLDVTNRFYFNLLDAEGRSKNGKKLPNKETLASLREVNHADDIKIKKEKFTDGQYWKLPTEIGFNLKNNLKIGRTSSQDTGVNSESDVIVATATLEVGYNDAEVGTIIQHKAPRSNSQFIQRKGRAGRSRMMRPWSIVILSDFGYDKITYQMFEKLFDPELDPNKIPYKNIYILKIQAVYVLMDWLANRLRNNDKILYGSVWYLFSKKSKTDDFVVRNLKDSLNELLDKEIIQSDFIQFLMKSLKIERELVNSILWDSPRSLLKNAIPTIIRRLERNWEGEADSPNNPLPEFVTSALFGELNLPELFIELPDSKSSEASENEPRQEQIGYFQGLREFSPGRVSARFMLEGSEQRHWVEVPFSNEKRESEIDFESFCASDTYLDLGVLSYKENGNEISYTLLRPSTIKVTIPDKYIKTNTNASPEWRSSFEQNEEFSYKLELPRKAIDFGFINEINCYLHSDQNPINVSRFVIGSEARILTNNDPVDTYVTFYRKVEAQKEAVAYGCTQFVDGLIFKFTYPDWISTIQNPVFDSVKRNMRIDYFKDMINENPEIKKEANKFERLKIVDFLLDSIISIALRENCKLSQSVENLKGNQELLEELLKEFLTTTPDLNLLDESFSLEEEITESVPLEPQDQNKKVIERYLSIFRKESVKTSIHDALSKICTDEFDSNWLKKRYRSTLGTAILQTIKLFVPNILDSDLILDIEDINYLQNNEVDNEGFIWITEDSPGGTGNIEKFVFEYHKNPSVFFDLLSSVLDKGDLELIDEEISWFLNFVNLSVPNVEISNLIANFRNCNSPIEKELAFTELKKSLSSKGRVLTHPILSSLLNRVLFSGSKPETDELLMQLKQNWEEIESKLGIEIESRAISKILAKDPNTVNLLVEVFKFAGIDEKDKIRWAESTLSNLFWARGGYIRSLSLSTYNPFATLPPTDRLLLQKNTQSIENILTQSTNDELFKQVSEMFNLGKSVSISYNNKEENLVQCKKFLHNILVNPVEEDVLHIFPAIKGVKYTDTDIIINLEIGD